MSDHSLTEDLLQRAQQGDETARNLLFTRYQPRILQIVRMLMGSELRRRQDSGDLVQETLLEAVKRLDGFESRGPGSLLAWLKKLAHSAVCAAADHWQRIKRMHNEVPLGEPSATGRPGMDVPGLLPGALERLVQSEACSEIEQCIAELSEDDRDLIVLRHYADQSWAEIATEVGRASASAARFAIGEAKARLAILVQRRARAGGQEHAAS